MARTETKHPGVTLGDLLAEEPFDLRLLSAGAEARERPLLGAQTVEVATPTRWLEPQWLMLSSGVRLRGDPRSQRDLIRELVHADVSALGFGIGSIFKRAPGALVEEAAALHFPVFEVPYETPFRAITRFVDGALNVADAHVFRRLSVLQRYLVDALRGPDPQTAILVRLAGFLDATAAVVSASGQIEAATGEAPIEELWPQVKPGPCDFQRLAAGEWSAVVVPIAEAENQPKRWLLVTSRRHGFMSRLVKPAAETAAPLLAATSTLDRLAWSQEHAVRAALLHEVLAELGSQEAIEVGARLTAFGLDFSTAARVIATRGANSEELDLIGRTLVSEFKQLGVPYLLDLQGEALIALVQGSLEEVIPRLEETLALHPGSATGIGRPAATVAVVPESFRDAKLAAERAALEPDRLLVFEEFDLPTFVIGEIAHERMKPKIDAVLGSLKSNTPLYEALVAYFQNDMDVLATASVLHLHPNSLRYRLSRVEALLEVSLKRPATIASLYLALIAETASPGAS